MKLKIILLIGAFALILCSCTNSNHNEYQGYVDGEFIFIASPFSGTLEKLDADRGDTVKKGQILFTLDPSPQNQQLQQAQSDLQQAKANLNNLIKGSRETILKSIEAEILRAQADMELAKIRLKRNQMLYQQKAVDKDTLDAAQTNYESSMQLVKKLQADLAEAKLGAREDLIKAQQAQVKAINARVDELNWSLQQKTLIAPASGYIYDSYYSQGEFVPQNQPVLSLLTPANIYIVFFIPVSQLPKVHIGDKLSITMVGSDKNYTATIDYISPKVEFTPPVIFSRENNYKYVFQVKALPNEKDALDFHPGAPVYVKLMK